MADRITRRRFAVGLTGAGTWLSAQTKPTQFTIGCMTLPYGAFRFERALEGIAAAGYHVAAWGVNHVNSAGQRVPCLAPDASPAQAAALAAKTRAYQLEPVMMFSTSMLEAPDAPQVHARRIAQAEAAQIPYLLTFGKTEAGAYENVIRCLRFIAPVARKAGVTVLVKQHGGNTATGARISKILAAVGEDSVKMCYDAGNVLDYENQDPIPDIQQCWRDVRAFAIKDHRNTPKDEDCGPGFGEIDHYKLLLPVAKTGLTIPLVCENIFEPLAPRPAKAEEVDRLARRAREFLETVVRGLATL
jgi:sugar phosphate isomerase/epimerase